MKNRPLILSLRARGVNAGLLARQICSSRNHVCEVLNNTPGHGGQTRKKLAPLLTPAERHLAGWDEHGNIVPRETQSST